MGGTDVPLRVGPIVIEVGRWVYGTVILMTVLMVYADEGQATFGESVGVVIAPMLATFLAHLFASILAAENSKPGGLNRAELAHLVRSDAQFLLLTVPPLLVLLIGALGAFGAPTALMLILWGGVALLVVVGALAGRRVGLGTGGIAASAVASGAIGVLILVIQVFLKD